MSGCRIPQGRCWRAKVIYLSEGAAARELARKPDWGKGMHPYYCPPCDAYHVGHTGKAVAS